MSRDGVRDGDGRNVGSKTTSDSMVDLIPVSLLGMITQRCEEQRGTKGQRGFVDDVLVRILTAEQSDGGPLLSNWTRIASPMTHHDLYT